MTEEQDRWFCTKLKGQSKNLLVSYATALPPKRAISLHSNPLFLPDLPWLADSGVGKRSVILLSLLAFAPPIASGYPGSPSSHRKRPDSTSRASLASFVPDPWPGPFHDALPSFTASLSALPGLNAGAVEAGIDRLSPVCGLRPVRAGRFLVPKVPNPAILTSSPFARVSPTASNTAYTAFPAADWLEPIRSATRPAMSDFFKRSLFKDTSCAPAA